MDFLNKSFAQIKDLFEGMTPGSRILAGLLLAVVVVSLGYLVTSGVNAGETYLFENRVFDSNETAAMQVAFSTAGLNDWDSVGGRIRVPRSERYLYLNALSEGEALPQNLDLIIEDSIKSISSYASNTLTKATLKAAKDQMVGKMIEGSPDIKSAHVISDSATRQSSSVRRTSRTTVTVSVTPSGSKRLEREDVQPIFHLVDMAYTEATLDDIVIHTTNGPAFRGRSEDDPSFGGGHLAKKREYEQHWENSITGLFSDIPGLVATATVELDPKLFHSEATITPDPESVAELVIESTSSHSSTSGGPGGNPGLGSQGGVNSTGRLATVAAGGTEDTTEDTESEISSRVGGTTTSSEFAPLTPKRVTVSITIPDSYIEAVWHKDNPPEADEEPKTPEPAELQAIKASTTAMIEELVEPMLRTGDGVAPAAAENQVNVAFLPSLTPEPLPEPTLVQGATGWLAQSWQTLGMFALALFSLMMLRSMVKSGRSVEIKAPAAESEKSDESKPDDEEGEVKKSLQPFGTSGASLKDELSELVSDDPDAAANILKNWIGTAANMK